MFHSSSIKVYTLIGISKHTHTKTYTQAVIHTIAGNYQSYRLYNHKGNLKPQLPMLLYCICVYFLFDKQLAAAAKGGRKEKFFIYFICDMAMAICHKSHMGSEGEAGSEPMPMPSSSTNEDNARVAVHTHTQLQNKETNSAHFESFVVSFTFYLQYVSSATNRRQTNERTNN